MGFSFRRWRPGHLLVAWSAYWLLLLLVGFRRELTAIWHLTSEPDTHGKIAAGITDGMFQLTIAGTDGTVLERSISLMTMLLWVAGPPFLLWIVWLLTRPRGTETGMASSATGP